MADELISEHPIFRGHTNIWAAMMPDVKTKHVPKGEALFCHGDSAGSFFIISRGWLSLTRQTPDGKETVTGLCTEGDILGEAALFPHASYPCNAVVIDHDTTVAVIPSRVIGEAIRNNKEFAQNIMSLLNERLSKTQLKLEHLNTLSAAQRMGCFLLNLCGNTPEERNKAVRMPVEKNIIAAYLGMKPETFSRSLQQLEAIGVKKTGNRMLIGNVGRLRQFVCNSCSESGTCDTKTYII